MSRRSSVGKRATRSNSTPEWTREIAAYIKELDPNHLVLDGKSLRGVPEWSLDDPNIDVITTHHYPWGEDHDYVRADSRRACSYQGEEGVRCRRVWLRRNAAPCQRDSSGDRRRHFRRLLWSLRMHRREGGFYWHMEVGTGRNIYKAYHWPGFDSGNATTSARCCNWCGEKAFEIRGLKPPPLEPPAPPKLLPIESASAISWQGSAGAAGYDVWRADEPDGTLGKNC